MKKQILISGIFFLITPVSLLAQIEILFEYCALQNSHTESFVGLDDGYAVVFEGIAGLHNPRVITFDNNNEEVWNYLIPFGDHPDRILSDGDALYITSDKGMELAGEPENDDICVTRLSLSGDFVWQTCFGGSLNDRPANACMGSNTIIVVGSGYSEDDIFSNSFGSSEGIVASIGLNGNVLSSLSFGGTRNDIILWADPLAEDGTHNILGFTFSQDGGFEDIPSVGAIPTEPNVFFATVEISGEPLGG
ncbi:MAG: hypothetical protein KBC22_02030 [Candidatus Pacebacteria bacterium]|nr:hypothetical protein [Candidatus Paceibacterota bacterium]